MNEPDGEVDLKLLEAVDILCDQFERDWRAGQNPTVEDLLKSRGDVPESLLLQYILPLERALRREAGEVPDVEQYTQRFPEYADLVARTLSDRGPAESTDQSGRTLADAFQSTRDVVDAHVRRFFVSRGRFEVLNRIGEGSYSVVYRAWDTHLSRFVAIKMPREGSDPERFRIEVQSLGRVTHPGIAQVHDVSADSEMPYIVLQYFVGGDLRRARGDSAMEPDIAATLMRDIALAVGAAHEQRVLHRDLKPSNVLLDDDGHPHVSDFGLARLLDDPERQTASGELLGTIEYMAPEQATGQATERSDVYSLGVMLFELLTARLPFEGSRAERLARLGSGVPLDLDVSTRGIPGELAAICRVSLAHSPHDRYANAGEVAADLSRYLDQQQPLAVAAEGRRARSGKRRRIAIAGLVVTTLLAALIGFALEWEPESIWFSHGIQYVNDVTVSPDGKLVATGASDGNVWLNERGLLTWPEDIRESDRLPTDSGGVQSIAMSPDGRQLAGGLSDGSIRLWSMPDRRVLRTFRAHEGRVMALRYSPDGSVLVSAGTEHTVRLWDPATGKLRRELLDDHKGLMKALEYSDDGHMLVSVGDYWVTRPVPNGLGSEHQVLLWDLQTDSRHELEFDYLRVMDVAVFGTKQLAFAVCDRKRSNPAVVLVDATTKTTTKVLPQGDIAVQLEFLDHETLAIGDSTGVIHILDLGSGAIIASFEAHRDEITEMKWSSAAGRLFSASYDGACVGTRPFWRPPRAEDLGSQH